MIPPLMINDSSILVFTDCGSDNPCKNGGNCTRQAFTTICDCSPNYTGEYCEILGMSKKIIRSIIIV